VTKTVSARQEPDPWSATRVSFVEVITYDLSEIRRLKFARLLGGGPLYQTGQGFALRLHVVVEFEKTVSTING
jgi:hypothetical protein